jgi:uncharacterized membrane protein
MTTNCCLRLTRFLTLLGLALAVTLPSVSATEPLPCPSAQCEAGNGDIAILSNIPYLSRLFRNVGIGHEENCQGCCEAIGVDFDFSFVAPCGNTCQTVTGQTTASCSTSNPTCKTGCPLESASQTGGKCTDTTCRATSKDCCIETACPAGYGVRRIALPAPSQPPYAPYPVPQAAYPVPAAVYPSYTAAYPYVAPTATPVGSPYACSDSASCPWMNGVGQYLTENAGLRAQVEIHEALLEQQAQMFSAILKATQSVTEAREEAKGERDELLEQLTSTLIANAELKAKLELAKEREVMFRELMAMQVENLQLKQQVESLARRTADEGVQLTGHAESLASPTASAKPTRRDAAKRTKGKQTELR